MTKPYLLLHLLLMISIILSGCANKPINSSTENIQILTSAERAEKLSKKTSWKLRGKIAFIQKVTNENDRRESASITWKVNEEKQTQELNLTSYLGINVLHLKSNPSQHVIEVDGKTYQGKNLPPLIYSLTGLTLPAEALTYWLKGLPYNTTDKIEYHNKTQLPISLSSYYNNALWQINYSQYQTFDGIKLAKKFTMTKDGLLIKVAINQWSFK